MKEDPRFLGIDVGGTTSAAVVGDASGAILQRVQWPSEAARGPETMIAEMAGHACEILGRAPGVVAAGVAIGGPLDVTRGLILSPPNLPGWDAVPLRDRLAEALGLPVRVEHDATACAMAEHRWGAGRGMSHLVYLTGGTGFGAGLVLGGRPHYGAGGRPGDLGHIRLRREGPVGYGRAGSVEGFCAASALTRIAAWHAPGRWGEEAPTPAQMCTRAAEGDEDAAEVLAISARAVGDVCAGLADLLYPEVIVLGSQARYFGPGWLEQVRDRFREEAYPAAAELCRVVPSELGDRLQDLSALVAAIEAWEAGNGKR
jgi:glucokinase